MINDYLDPLALLTTAVVVVLAVLIHYEGLHFFTHWMRRTTTIKPRFRIVLMIYGLLLLHAAEIWLFGLGFWVLSTLPGYGSLVAMSGEVTELDTVYFSATVYSTLGFGDITPVGTLRLLAGIEAVTGLLMITWSASFTYIEMVRYWRED